MLDIFKIKTVSTDSIKLSNVVDNDVAKNTVYNELIIKVMKSRMLLEQTKQFLKHIIIEKKKRC